ncbi:alpha/beta fold hydrolase [Streptomyces sp. NPDC002666]
MSRGGRLVNFLLALVSRDRAGVPVALMVTGAGIGLVVAGSDWVVALGAPVMAVGVVLLAGAVRHLVLVARGSGSGPPGRLVDVGGRRMHVLAEGDSGGGPTVVWMPGGHAPGKEFGQLHAMLADSTRSVLVDRFGSGWSDVGPFPRTTAAEAEELLGALEGAGERAPYLLVGHSLGGLLVANVARRRPDLVAGVVLLDPTPLEVIAFAPPDGPVAGVRGKLLLTAVRHLFGLHRGRGREVRTGQYCAAASIFGELSPGGLAGVGWETVVYDGDLGELPLVLVIPRDLTGGESVLAAAGDAVEAARIGRFYRRARTRYLAASTASRLVYAPAGSGHGFPAESPAFVVGVVADQVRSLRTTGP